MTQQAFDLVHHPMMELSPFDDDDVSKEMARRVKTARGKVADIKRTFMPGDQAQQVEERLCLLEHEIEAFFVISKLSKKRDADRQGKLFRYISWGLDHLMTRSPWPKDIPPPTTKQQHQAQKRPADSVNALWEQFRKVHESIQDDGYHTDTPCMTPDRSWHEVILYSVL